MYQYNDIILKDIDNIGHLDISISYKTINNFIEQNGPNCAIAVTASILNIFLPKLIPSTQIFEYTLQYYRDKYPNDKYLNKNRPSSKKIGNKKLINAINYLSNLNNLQININFFINKINNVNTKSSNYLWNQLKISFQEKDTIIICHIKNHYALIFGLRKYNHMKEVLTSRKGQSPKHWIPWKDLLHTICTYRIYNILTISKSYNMSYSGFRF